MRAHTWVTKTDYAPAIGEYDYTVCSVCGASAPSVFQATPFFADASGLKVSDDCDEAKAQIEKHVVARAQATHGPTPPVRISSEARVGPPQEQIPVDQMRDFERTSREMADLGYQLWGYSYEHLDAERMQSFADFCEAERAESESRWAQEVAAWRRSREE